MNAEIPLTESHRVALARAFQDAAARQLCAKLLIGLGQLAMRDIKPRHVVVSGGVASNSFLRARHVILWILVTMDRAQF